MRTLLAVVVLALPACGFATSTPYAPMSRVGGWHVSPLGEREWLLTVDVNALTHPSVALAYWHRRAAELTRDAGCGEHVPLELVASSDEGGWSTVYGRVVCAGAPAR